MRETPVALAAGVFSSAQWEYIFLFFYKSCCFDGYHLGT